MITGDFNVKVTDVAEFTFLLLFHVMETYYYCTWFKQYLFLLSNILIPNKLQTGLSRKFSVCMILSHGKIQQFNMN